MKPLDSRDQAIQIAKILEEKKLENIVILDVSQLIPITSFFVIATSMNPKQSQAALDELEAKAKELGLEKRGIEGDRNHTEWLLVDYGDVVVHIFEEYWRDYYGLEMLWGDAEKVEWRQTSES